MTNLVGWYGSLRGCEAIKSELNMVCNSNCYRDIAENSAPIAHRNKSSRKVENRDTSQSPHPSCIFVAVSSKTQHVTAFGLCRRRNVPRIDNARIQSFDIISKLLNEVMLVYSLELNRLLALHFSRNAHELDLVSQVPQFLPKSL